MEPSEGSSPQNHSAAVIRTALDIGRLVKQQRNEMNLRQLDVAGLANTGNRLIVDVENGKPTVQLQKVLDLLDILGLEVVIQPKTSRTL
ncbi:MAG: transcriptional regulator [Aquabacterium sp.]|jgi:y4mF family transcriptional regulator